MRLLDLFCGALLSNIRAFTEKSQAALHGRRDTLGDGD